MTGSPAARPLAHTPDGDRSDLQENRVQVRSFDGRFPIRTVSAEQANKLVNGGAAFWRRSLEIWLTEEATPHDGNPCTWHGSSRPGRVQPGTYRPNHRVCGGYNRLPLPAPAVRVKAAVELSAKDSMNGPERNPSQRNP
jgi:hypothetical protein